MFWFRYELILDQLNPWNIDPEFLVDFLFLPDSYFYAEAPEKFQNFIQRYGTHVIVSAKFGGEFKIMHTMRKSKTTSIDKFAEKCNREILAMFSRGAKVEGNVELLQADISGSFKHNSSIKIDTGKEKESSKRYEKYFFSRFNISLKVLK